jgi:phospholipase C
MCLHLVFAILFLSLWGCGGSASSSNSGSNPQQNPPPGTPGAVTASISADKSMFIAGDSVTLTWTSANATAAIIDNGIGAVPTSGSQQVKPTTDTTYTLTASSANGTATASVTIKLSDTRSPVKHLIVVVMQNRSFDHLFGKFPGAAGAMPGDPGFIQRNANGTAISPFLLGKLSSIDLEHSHAAFVQMVNGGKMDQYALVNGPDAMGFYDSSVPGIDILWSLAQQFSLADHFFASVLGDAPTNQLYLVAASDNNFPFGVEPFYGPCNKPDGSARPYRFPNAGDQLTAKKISWTWFAENYGRCGDYQDNQNPFQYFASTHGTGHIQDFSRFRPALTNGSLPAVVYIQPTDAHAMHPSSGATVTEGAQWLANLVQSIQNSSIWPDAAIVVLWDSSGGWYDHVPPPAVDTQGLGPRAPLLVISPFSKRNYISKVQMDDVSILKFIQWNWGLPSLNPRNDSPASGDLRDMFAF